jgi:hypothetical protein
MMHVSFLSCLSASPIDAGFLYGEDTMLRVTVNGTLQEIMHWKGHNQMIVTDLMAGIRKETIIILYEQFPRQVE